MHASVFTHAHLVTVGVLPNVSVKTYDPRLWLDHIECSVPGIVFGMMSPQSIIVGMNGTKRVRNKVDLSLVLGMKTKNNLTRVVKSK